MSTNGINVCEDAEMADCDGDKVVTMMDVLKEQEDFEEDANAVLGASDDKNCTYSKGYIKRQAIYACMTCTDAKNDPTKRAGVCLACSLTCHENHELIELYTKRNFRCDCGNPKFNSHPCQFTPDKTDLNIENIYNQNFSGVYCTCHRPYPDPESNAEGDMIQCVICEDWLHCNHLDAIVPSNEQFSEMICKACMDKNEFLHDYSELVINKENMDVDILNTSSETIPMSNNKESTKEQATDEQNASSNRDVTESAQNENDDTSIADVKNTSKSDLTNEQDFRMEEQSKNTSESYSSPHDSLGNNSNESDISKLNTTDKIVEEQSKPQPEGAKELVDTSNSNPMENKTSLMSSESQPEVKHAGGPDNRSQEQVEEDMLLADPMDTGLNQKEAANVTSSSVTKAIEVASSDEKECSSQVLNNSEVVKKDEVEGRKDDNKGDDDESKTKSASYTERSDTVITGESLSVSTSEQTENIAGIEQKEGILSTGRSEDVNTITGTESTLTENVAITENSESMSSTDPSEKTPNSEQSKSLCDNSVDEKLNQNDKTDNDDDSLNKSTIREENENVIHKNSTDTLMTESITSEAGCNKLKDNETVVNSNCNDDKAKETDILKRKHSADVDMENVEVKKLKLENKKCVRPTGVKKVHFGATFWPSSFRQKLCTCNECLSMYKNLSVLFLTDPDDTVTAYERLGKEKTDGKPASQYEKGMAALSSLGRVQQINALTEYAKLRDKLLDFLKTFKDKKVIVKEEDIKAFFAGMKPVREPDGVYFCR